jgi:AraC-like DNA-binding protein
LIFSNGIPVISVIITVLIASFWKPRSTADKLRSLYGASYYWILILELFKHQPIRIEEAKKILTGPGGAEKKNTAVALDVGFNSMTAFYKAFKKFTGMTPNQYKKESATPPSSRSA